MMRYARWIAEHAAGDVSGRCDPMTEAMAQAVPRAGRVCGLYVVPDAERDRVAARGGTPLRAPGHYEELARTPTEVGRAV